MIEFLDIREIYLKEIRMTREILLASNTFSLDYETESLIDELDKLYQNIRFADNVSHIDSAIDRFDISSGAKRRVIQIIKNTSNYIINTIEEYAKEN